MVTNYLRQLGKSAAHPTGLSMIPFLYSSRNRTPTTCAGQRRDKSFIVVEDRYSVMFPSLPCLPCLYEVICLAADPPADSALLDLGPETVGHQITSFNPAISQTLSGLNPRGQTSVSPTVALALICTERRNKVIGSSDFCHHRWLQVFHLNHSH